MSKQVLLLRGACAALALVCVQACKHTDATRAKSEPRTVTREALPAERRTTWEKYEAGGAAWELERELVRKDPAQARFIVDNCVRTLVRSYDNSNLARAGQRGGPFERAQDELVELAEHSTLVLVELLAVQDGVVAFLAADTLARIGRRAVEPVSSLLADERPQTRRRACELLGRLPHAEQNEIEIERRLAERVEKDPEWIVRGEAAGALGKRGARHSHKGFAMGPLVRALRDPDSAVQESAGVALEELGEPRAIPALIRALSESASAGHVPAVRAIERALAALSGDAQQRSPEQWGKWWSEHEAELVQKAQAASRKQPDR